VVAVAPQEKTTAPQVVTINRPHSSREVEQTPDALLEIRTSSFAFQQFQHTSLSDSNTVTFILISLNICTEY
jgi:hypothetical protein